jgi:hypothetical protein
MRLLCAAAVTAIAFVASSASEAWACRCAKTNMRQLYQRADAVVVGRVVALEVADAKSGTIKSVVSVAKSWKHPVRGQVTIHTEGTCAFHFEAGKRYLLYLTKASGAAYGTTLCSGNQPAARAASAIRWLDQHGKAKRAPRKPS